MLNNYNILYPAQFQILKDDSFIKNTTRVFNMLEDIISANNESVKQGAITIPTYIEDIDDDYFAIKDISGENISSQILMVSVDGVWSEVDFEDEVDKSDDLYSKKGSILYCVQQIEPILFHRSIQKDQSHTLFSLDLIPRLEKYYNMRFGATVSLEEEIDSFSEETGVLVTDKREVIIKYPNDFQYEEGDTVPKDELFDKPISLEIVEPYVEIILKRENEYLLSHMTFNANKKVRFND